MPYLGVSIDQDLLRQMITALESTEPKRLLSATKSAIRSGAYFFRASLKEATKQNRYGWERTQAPVLARVRANPPVAGLKAFRKTTAKQSPFLGKLANVFRYSMAPDGLSALVGVLSESVGAKGFEYFKKFQIGGERQVVPSMRGYFGAIGLPLKRVTTQIRQPARPVVEPTWERERGRIGQIMAAKLQEKIGGL